MNVVNGFASSWGIILFKILYYSFVLYLNIKRQNFKCMSQLYWTEIAAGFFSN